MKLLYNSKKVRRIVSVMVGITLIISPLSATLLLRSIADDGFTSVDLSKLKSYYSTSLNSANLTETKFSDKWDYEDGTLTRINSTSPGGEFDDIAMLYLDTKSYEDFVLEADYYRNNPNGGGAFIGFDGTLGKSWKDVKNGTMLWDYSGYARIRGSSGSTGGIVDGWGNGVRIPNDASLKWRHIKISLIDKTLSMWIDNLLVLNIGGFGTDWYNGGYIFLASNINDSAFKNLKIKSVIYEEPKFDGVNDFYAYYSTSLSTTDPKACDYKDNWDVADGVYTRKNASNVGGEFADMAILYYEKQKYRNFALELDYYRPTDKNSAFIGFGGVPGKAWDDAKCGTMLWEHSTYGRIRGSSGPNGGIIDGWGNGHSVTACNGNAWHHYKLQVKGSVIIFEIDNEVVLKIDNLGEWYEGGYIFLASNANNTAFKNINITDLGGIVTNDFSKYDSYFTEYVGDKKLEKTEAKNLWTEDKGTIIRKPEEFQYTGSSWNNSSYHLGKMAYLFLNGDYTKYDNYTVDLDFTMGSGSWGRTYIGIGATDYATWREENGGLIFFSDSGGSTGFEGNITKNGSLSANVFGAALNSFNASASHHLKISVAGEIINFYVDGVEVKTLVEEDYLKNGKIFFASNSTGATYENIDIKEVPSSESGFAGYDEWFGEDVKKGSLKDSTEGKYWSSINGVVTRKSVSADKDVQNYIDMGYLYLTDRKYKNFKIEFDYKHGVTGWQRAGLGFGAEIGKDFFDENGGFAVYSQPGGIVHYDGNLVENGIFTETVFWPTYDDDGNDITTVAPYDNSSWHHMILTVEDGYASMTIDEFDYIYEISLPKFYDGGYIYLFSNSTAAQYKNIQIEDLTVVVDPSIQATWTPTKEDLEFDFTQEDYRNDVFEWKFKTIQ